MMSPGVIHDMALKAARKAAREKKIPLVIEKEDLEVFRAWEKASPVRVQGRAPASIPFLGGYVPKGWTRTKNEFFVDSSGWGAPGELALTFSQFLDKVIPGRGYAVIEAGQFQVYMAEYLPPRAK